MHNFTLNIENQLDIPAVLNEALSRNMGSLNASREQWASLLNAMGVDLYYSYHRDAPKKSVEEALISIIEGAVPEEGEINPRRATFRMGNDWICFQSPGGVKVTILGSVGKVSLLIEFGRNSRHLATLVLADLFRRVPEAAPLLAEAAREAAVAD